MFSVSCGGVGGKLPRHVAALHRPSHRKGIFKWDADGGFAEYVTVPAAYALPLNDVRMDALEMAPLMCPGIAGYAAFKLTEVRQGDRLGLYGFGPTAYCVLKVAQVGSRHQDAVQSEKV